MNNQITTLEQLAMKIAPERKETFIDTLYTLTRIEKPVEKIIRLYYQSEGICYNPNKDE